MTQAHSDVRNALPIGTVVREFEVESLLGHGGYSVVYRARHVELRHIVALKEYLPADLSVREGKTVFPRSTECAPHYEDGKRRFLEEAKRIVEFKDDPGVVACLGFFRANGTAYLVLEHVDGMSLAELLRQRESAGRPLDEGELRSLVLPLLETLSRLHGADVLHRDIKPSNILVRRSDGSPVLIDFGAAKQQAALHSKSIAPFTEGYAALEQVGEGELGPWTDVYAIGAVMWRIVAGDKPPWEPPNPKKVELRATAVLTGNTDPLPSASELGKGRFTSTLLEAIDKCLKIRHAERTPNCEKLRIVITETVSTAELTTMGKEAHSRPDSISISSERLPKSKPNYQVKIRPYIPFFIEVVDLLFAVFFVVLMVTLARIIGGAASLIGSAIDLFLVEFHGFISWIVQGFWELTRKVDETILSMPRRDLDLVGIFLLIVIIFFIAIFSINNWMDRKKE